jgi:uncharacterized protein (DUF488 family)
MTAVRMSGDSSRESGPADADQSAGSRPLLIYTLGHSTLSPDAFLELLRHYRIECLVDVRTIPRSLHNPQFNKETLSPFLRIRRIKYLHMKDLGGLRRYVKTETVNAGWRNASFRGFADYMQTPTFAVALAKLVKIAQARTTAIMCAEAVPWRCHRSLIGDALLVRGFQVVDILSASSAQPHALTAMAKVEGVRITYPAAEIDKTTPL